MFEYLIVINSGLKESQQHQQRQQKQQTWDSFVKRYFSLTQLIYVAVCNSSSSLRMKQHFRELKVWSGAKFEISQPNSKQREKGPRCSGWLSFSRFCSNYIKSLVLALSFCKRDINNNHHSFSKDTPYERSGYIIK